MIVMIKKSIKSCKLLTKKHKLHQRDLNKFLNQKQPFKKKLIIKENKINDVFTFRKFPDISKIKMNEEEENPDIRVVHTRSNMA